MVENKSREQRALEEFARRVGGEVEKAIEKYGEVALAAEGHPEYDIFDYLINELVGMQRYGEMVVARAKLMEKTGVIDRHMLQTLKEIGADCHGASIDIGVRLIMARQKMQDAGLMLGKPEKSYKKTSDNTVTGQLANPSYKTRNSVFPS